MILLLSLVVLTGLGFNGLWTDYVPDAVHAADVCAVQGVYLLRVE